MILHETLLQYAGLISLGFAVSTYGTLIGAGGGFVLMPLLLLLYPHENPHHLTAISLTVVFLTPHSGRYFRCAHNRLCFPGTVRGGIFRFLDRSCPVHDPQAQIQQTCKARE
jgi:uncharacterized membrane protein YfcA